MSEWKEYRKKGTAEFLPYAEGMDLTGVSVSAEDKKNMEGGMIARDPNNKSDQWFVNAAYFAKHYEPVD